VRGKDTMNMKSIYGKTAAVLFVVAGLLPALAGDIIYVNPKGTEVSPYATVETAAKTVYTALSAVTAERNRIKISGTVQETASVTLSNVEVFADSWTNATWKGQQGGSTPIVTLKENAFVHGIKFDTWRVKGGLTLAADTACVSNCWIKNMYFSTAGSPATSAAKGLVTHCLYSGCHCNYGPIVTLSGTATMRNCVFTGNRLDEGNDATKTFMAPIALSGTATLANNIVYGNWAALPTGGAVRQVCAGVYVASGSPTICNNIVRNNKINGTLETGTICNYYLAGGTPIVCNNNSDEGFGEAAQTGDPKFVSLDMTKEPDERDFHIAAASPCVDAGAFVTFATPQSGTDYYGNNRIQGFKIDIGVNEVTKATPMMSVSSSAEIYYDEQDVVFTATSTNAAAPFPAGTIYNWTVNGEEQAETGASLTLHVAPVADYTVTATANGYFSDTKTIQVKYKPGVEFTSEVVAQKANYSLVDFSAYGVGGLVFYTGAVFKWYRGLHGEALGAEPFATGKDVASARFDVGTWDVKVVVENADGHGMRLERLHENEVTVEPASVSVGFSETTGEGRTLIGLSGTASGFAFDDAAVFEWRWTTDGKMPEEPFATGNPATGTFFPGTWTVQLIVTDADGAGACFTNTIANALSIADGADYYVSAGGSVTNAGTKASPYNTLNQALAQPAFGTERKKICILGMVTQNEKVTLADVELYGEGWTNSCLHHTAGYQNPVFSITNNVLVHGLKFTSGSAFLRALYYLTDSSSVISNCWFSNLSCNTVQNNGEIAGHATAGLITHCLFSGISSANGGGETLEYGLGFLSLYGTARMVNSVFTGNHHNNNTRGPNDGVLTVAGDAVLENCVIYDNYTKSTKEGDATQSYYRPRNGGGVCVRSGSPTIRNCIIRKNLKPHTPSDGKYPTETGEDIYSATEEGDIYIADGATPTIENCNLPEGQIPAGATNCQTGDPKFTDPDNPVLVERDFSISGDSPCRNAGLEQPWQKTATDYTGVEPRFQGGRVDIGAYEYPDGVYLPGMVIIFRERSSE